MIARNMFLEIEKDRIMNHRSVIRMAYQKDVVETKKETYK